MTVSSESFTSAAAAVASSSGPPTFQSLSHSATTTSGLIASFISSSGSSGSSGTQSSSSQSALVASATIVPSQTGEISTASSNQILHVSLLPLIIGLVVGIVALMAIVAGIVIFVRRRTRRQRRHIFELDGHGAAGDMQETRDQHGEAVAGIQSGEAMASQEKSTAGLTGAMVRLKAHQG